MSHDKENQIPNTLFSNPIISANLTKDIFSCKPSRKTKTKAKCQENQSENMSQNLHCSQHKKVLGNIFCADCLTFNMCQACIQDGHCGHEIKCFDSSTQMIDQTKEILLQKLEETLKGLKSKENDVKNKSHEISLIRSSLKTLEEDIVGVISGIFKQIEGKLLFSLQKEHEILCNQTDTFFQTFHQTNDELRESLMKILDGDINIIDFNKAIIIKQPPKQPNFQKHKSQLQKFKRIFKDVKIQLLSAKTVLEQGYEKLQSFDNQKFKNVSSSVSAKFEKYISIATQNKGERVNQSFLRTLKLIENGNGKDKLSFLDKQKSKSKLNPKIF